MRFSGAGGTVADPGVPSPPRAGLHDLRGLLRIVGHVRKGGTRVLDREDSLQRLNEIKEGRSLLGMAAGRTRKEKRR